MSSFPTDGILAKVEPVAEAALLHEALGKRGALNHDVTPAFPGAKLLGRALTIRGCAGDNLMLHQAISVARPGDVLVATVDGYLEAGIWGEIATVAAQVRGIRGLVTDGAVRDTEQIARLGFPVFSRARCIKGTTKRQKGALNEPITLAGVTIQPGDILVGDADGVVVVPASEVETAVARAHEIRKREEGFIERIRQGELTLDVLGLRKALKELGLEE